MAQLNVSPYYDDFDEFKNFHQILFKPGYAVQARELTQLQSILKDQIAKFGNHVFKHGSVVIPGNSYADLSVPYVKIQPTYSGNNVDFRVFENKVLVNANGVRAHVRKAVAASNLDPITFYLAYLSAGSDGSLAFSRNDELTIENLSSNDFKVLTEDSGTFSGVGSLAFVNTGVYYVNGMFVTVDGQSVVIDKYGQAPSCSVLLKITEQVIDYIQDETLLDPAQGSYNFAAPGADRLKVTLELTTLGLGDSITEDFIELMRYSNGELKEHARYPRYNELEKVLARRTFDEAGDFVVSGLAASVTAGSATDKLSYNVSAGKAYISGFEVDAAGTKSVEVDKARTTKPEATKIVANYGQYIYLCDLVQGSGILGVNSALTLKNSAGTTIGSAKILNVDFETTNTVKAYIHAISFTGTNQLKDVVSLSTGSTTANVARKFTLYSVVGSFSTGSTVTVSAGGSTIRNGVVVDWVPGTNSVYLKKSTLNLPVVGDTIVNSTNSGIVRESTIIVNAGQPSLIFDVGRDYVASITEVQYTAIKVLTINAGSSTSESIPIDETVVFEDGTFVAVDSSGLKAKALFELDPSGKAIKLITGTATTTIKIYVQVLKESGVERAKTRTVATSVTVSMTAGRATLPNNDVYFISKVIKNNVNVTSRFSLVPQLSDYSYENTQIVSTDSTESGNITVDYEYFAHGGSGDFFAVDSYTDGYESIPLYVSPTNGTQYTMSDCLDFRPLVDVLAPGSIISVDLERYLGRTDSVCMDKNGGIRVLQGVPSDNPVAPPVSGSYYELERITLEPYTRYPDSYTTQRVATTRYTMEDIADIEQRVANLEEFSTLSAVEANLVARPIIDADTGLDRFKTGYLVEDCTNPFGVAAWDTSEFSAYFDRDGFKPKVNMTEVGFVLDDTTLSNMVVKGNVLMLDYTEEVFAQVATSTRVTNLNPYLVVSWKGDMVLVPPSIEWIESVDLPEIIRSVRATITQNIRMRAPVFRSNPPPVTAIRVSPASVQNPSGSLTFDMLNAAGNWVPVAPGLISSSRNKQGDSMSTSLSVSSTTRVAQ